MTAHGPADAPPAVHIEDQGEPDVWGRVEAIVRLDGVIAARMHYAAWPGHLVLYELHPEPDAPADVGARIIDVLLDLYPNRTPDRITHSAVHEPAVLAWYAGTHLAPGLLVCGAWGTSTLFYDPIGAIDPSAPPDVVLEGFDPVTLTVMYVADLHALGATEPTLADVWDWMHTGSVLGRFAAIRRLAVTPGLDPELRRWTMYLALLNENSGVRQFSSIHLGGYFPELQLRSDVVGLNRLLADPLRIYDHFGRAPEGLNAAQSRRNARYALAWTLGNVCWNAQGWGAQDWAEDEAQAVRDTLADSLARFDDARDAWLYRLALNEFADDPELRFGMGTPEPVDLFDFLRFAVLRKGIVQRLGFNPTDRFYWLTVTADGILGRPPEDGEEWTPTVPAAARIYAPPPSDELPPVEAMPTWLDGPNHLEFGLPAEVTFEVDGAAGEPT